MAGRQHIYPKAVPANGRVRAASPCGPSPPEFNYLDFKNYRYSKEE